jgi:hypothetical protein
MVALVRRCDAEMIRWRLAVPTLLSLSALAGCLTYFLIAPAPVSQPATLAAVEPSTVGQARATDRTNVDGRPSDEEIASAFRQATEVDTLRPVTDVRWLDEVQEAPTTGTDEPIAGPIPLPRKRPAKRP